MFKRLMILMVLAGLFAGCTAFGEEEEFDERGKILFEGDIAGMGYISDTVGHRRSGVLQVRIGGGKIAQVPFSGDYYSKIELSSPIKVYRDVCIINHSEGELEIGCRGDDVSVRNLIIEQPPITVELGDTPTISEVNPSVEPSTPRDFTKRYETSDLISLDNLDNLTVLMTDVRDSETTTICETIYLNNKSAQYCRPELKYDYELGLRKIIRNKSVYCVTDGFPDQDFATMTEIEKLELEQANGSIKNLLWSKMLSDYRLSRLTVEYYDEDSYFCRWQMW